jgi:FkbM family methyltransferase
MMALMASLLIGRKGRGFAFEPNPERFARLVRHLELNRVSNIEPIPFAFSNEDSEIELVVPCVRSSGDGWFAINHEASGEQRSVRTAVSRAYFERLDPTKPTIIKVNVEDHALDFLSGIEDALHRDEIAIVCAVDRAFPGGAGHSLAALYELVAKYGFRPFRFEVRRGRLWADLAITELKSSRDAPLEERSGLLFAKPDSKIFRDRVAPYLTSDTKKELASRMRIRVVLERSRPPARPTHSSSSTHPS